MNALIGSTGFVGSNLARQTSFERLLHSRNIESIRGERFELVVCAGVQARKWWANEHPEEDWAQIQALLDVLATIQADRFILISTVDVYPRPAGVTEATPIEGENHAYGRHRRAVEEFVEATFPRSQIVRLPGLFGAGLKKNVVFDLLHEHALEQINPAGRYQYYYLRRLWPDLQRCLADDIPLINFATPPVRTETIVERFFPELRERVAQSTPFVAQYDMRTVHAAAWGSPCEGYLQDEEAVLADLGEFIAGERAARA